MNIPRYLMLLATVTCSPAIQAQAFKCKDLQGKTFISSQPCQDGKVPVTSVQREHIPVERQLEAITAHNQRRATVDRIDAAYEASVRAQQRYHATQRTAQQPTPFQDRACEAASRPYPGAQNGQLTAAQRATLAQCAGGGSPTSAPNFNNNPPPAPPVPPQPVSVPKPPALITNCDASGCWDTQGVRYHNTGGGNTHRQDGRFCQNIGDRMHCN